MAYIVTYSENMYSGFMKSLCPSAKLELECLLTGCRLVLRRLYMSAEFSLEQGSEGDSVPAVVWHIDSKDEKNLMEYYPEGLFERINFRLILEKMQMEAFLFVVRSQETALPDDEYIEMAAEAYEEHGFDFWYVEQALDSAADMINGVQAEET